MTSQGIVCVCYVSRTSCDKTCEMAFIGFLLVKGDGRAEYQTLIVLMAFSIQFNRLRISDNQRCCHLLKRR